MNLRSLLPSIREVARQVIRCQLPEVESQFEKSWMAMERSLAWWAKTSPERWRSKELERAKASGISYRGVAVPKEAAVLAFISTIAAVLYNLAGFSFSVDEDEVYRLVLEYARRYGMKPTAVKPVSDIINQLRIVWLEEASDLQGQRLCRQVGFRYEGREPPRIEIGCEGGVPRVRFDGHEAPIFRSREYAFAMFCLLACSRLCGEGWLHKVDDLHGEMPHTRELYKLRSEYLGALGLKDLIVGSGRRDGRVRLNLPRESIEVQPSLSLFVSLHKKNVLKALEFLSSPKKKEGLKYVLRHLEIESYRLGRNSSMIQKALHLLGWELNDVSWKEAIKRAIERLSPWMELREGSARLLRKYYQTT